MAFNPRDTFTISLSVFGSLVEDIEAPDLPEGVSPDNSDCFYLPGSVFTRPALIRALPTSVGDATILSVKEFTLVNGQNLTVFLDSNGKLQYNNPTLPNTNTLMTSVTPGVQFNAANSFNKQFYALSSPQQAETFSSNPFVGCDIPIYYDGTDVYRVTYDGPCQAPHFGNVATTPLNIVPTVNAGTATVTGVTTGGTVTTSVSVPVHHNRVPFISLLTGTWPQYMTTYETVTTTFYSTLIYTCSTLVPISWLSQSVTITALSAVNLTGVITAISGFTFTISYQSTAPMSLSAQHGTVTLNSNYMIRSGNVVAAYVGSADLGYIQPGFWVSVLNADGSVINGPDWPITSQSQGTNGVVTVTLSIQLTNLCVGSIVYINGSAAAYSGACTVTNGDGVVTRTSGDLFTPVMTGGTIILGGTSYAITAVGGTSTLSIGSPYQGTTGSVAWTSAVTIFPAGVQSVFQVIPSAPGTTVFTYQSNDLLAISSTAGGSVYQRWSPSMGALGNAAQVLSTGNDPVNGNYFTFQQLGPDIGLNALSGKPQVQIQAQIPQGTRYGSVIFTSADGAQTAPAIPVSVNVVGGTSLLSATGIPIGPHGTANRTLIFTPAEGNNYYYVAPSPFSPLAGVNQVIATGTVIPDNISTSAVIDFTDQQLTSGNFTQVDIQGNDLFGQAPLPPALGVTEYQFRLFWWGCINLVPNLLNMGFDGGYVAPQGIVTCTASNTTVTLVAGSGAYFQTSWAGATIYLNSVPYVILSVTSPTALVLTQNYAGTTSSVISYYVLSPLGTAPLYWDSSEGDGAGTLSLPPVGLEYLGFAYTMKTGYNNLIQQTAFQDIGGAPVLIPNTSYIFRMQSIATGGVTVGNLVADIYSPTQGTLSSATIPVSSLPTATSTWTQLAFNALTPPTIPADTVFRLYLQDTIPGGTVIVDELEVIYADEPILNTTLLFNTQQRLYSLSF